MVLMKESTNYYLIFDLNNCLIAQRKKKRRKGSLVFLAPCHFTVKTLMQQVTQIENYAYIYNYYQTDKKNSLMYYKLL